VPVNRAMYAPPVPIQLPYVSPAVRARRAAKTLAVFATELGPLLGRRQVLRRDVTAKQTGRALRHAFDQLGSTYVKFGQLIASSPGAFGPDVSNQFRTLLDEGKPVPFYRVRAAVEAAYGAPLEDTFASFEEEPLAAASMAVVHRAVLPDGRNVAVKVLRPGMAERVARDVDIMQPLFKRLGLWGVDVAGILYRYLAGFRRQVAEELDLRNEARTMLHFRALIEEVGLETIAIPEPIDGMVTEQVLTMEFFDGVAIDDLDAVEELGGDPKPLVRALLDFWFLTGIRYGVFHGDIHAGNLMLLRDGRLGLIDWGIVGVLDDKMHHVFRSFVAAMLGDASAFAEVAEFLQTMLPFVGDEADGLLDEARNDISGLLTAPFGTVDLGDMVRDARGSTSTIDGETEEQRAARVTRMKRQRRFERQALRSGVADTEFGQANFLLFKQLLYFDRYGKMYLADEALLGNTDLLLKLLAEEPG
jgi:predicted unusual protein kinase regulating ubiquinone biosynthesis (AarF/ABC1/UbiB family)